MSDREKTQDFAVRDVLISYYGQILTGDLIDEIANELRNVMRGGPMSWAFKPQEQDDD